MKKATWTILLIIIAIYTSHAQSTIRDSNGRPVSSTKNVEIEGSPYLFDDWKNGNVKLTNGTVYDNTELKVDLLENQLLFKGSNNEPLMFSEPVKEFIIFPNNDKINGKLFRNGYGNNIDFYEVLVDSKCQLLESHKKSIGAKASYGSSTTVRIILDAINYYIYKSNSLLIVRKDKKSILSALRDKQNEIENYIKANNIKFKDENDLAKLVTYYNSL